MPKYGDKRPNYVATKLFLTRMSTITKETGGYSVMGYWEDLAYYQGADTYRKLEQLKKHVTPATYDNLLAILKEDDAKNPLD